MSKIHEPPKVTRVQDGNLSAVEPPFDPAWSDLDKLRWHAAVTELDTGLPIRIVTGASKTKRHGEWQDEPGLYGYHIVGGVGGGAYTYPHMWAFINGISVGARAREACAQAWDEDNAAGDDDDALGSADSATWASDGSHEHDADSDYYFHYLPSPWSAIQPLGGGWVPLGWIQTKPPTVTDIEHALANVHEAYQPFTEAMIRFAIGRYSCDAQRTPYGPARGRR